MICLQNLSENLQNDDEPLVILSALGFNIKDWPFIKKIGCKNILTSGLLDKLIITLCEKNQLARKFLENFREQLDRFYKNNGFFLTPNSNSVLFNNSSPLLFFGRGDKNILFNRPAVSIVGSRNASNEAKEFTKNLAASLSRENILVVSGGANGIDMAAHLGASEGCTAVVLGVPVNFLGDERNSQLRDLGKNKAVFISPFGPWQPLKNYLFIKRNQFIATLGDALVVIEGMEGSGTLHTTKFALELKKNIFAVPGALSNKLSFVPNSLLAKGLAKALINSQILIEAVKSCSPLPHKKNLKSKTPKKNFLELENLPLLIKLLKLNNNALTIDELIKKSGFTLGDIQNQMLEYEMEGMVKRVGAQFVLMAN